MSKKKVLFKKDIRSKKYFGSSKMLTTHSDDDYCLK